MSFFSGVGDFFKGAGGALISGVSSLFGGIQQSNSAASSIRDQEAFQNQQSSTSYQRAVQDMQAAGLNPMLAYQNGGASSGAGASFVPQNILGNAANSAVDAFSSISSSINNLSTAASTKAGMPTKEMENTIPDLINQGVTKLKSILNNSAGSPLSRGDISVEDLAPFGASPSSAAAAGTASTGSAETDYLTQLTGGGESPPSNWDAIFDPWKYNRQHSYKH